MTALWIDQSTYRAAQLKLQVANERIAELERYIHNNLHRGSDGEVRALPAPKGLAMIALFCGSRHWTDQAMIADDVMALPQDAIVVHGGQKGADVIAGEIAWRRGLHVAPVHAHWGLYGGSAGPRRNKAMIELQPDIVYAYPLGGPGTAGMIKLAQDAGIETVIRTKAP